VRRQKAIRQQRQGLLQLRHTQQAQQPQQAQRPKDAKGTWDFILPSGYVKIAIENGDL